MASPLTAPIVSSTRQAAAKRSQTATPVPSDVVPEGVLAENGGVEGVGGVSVTSGGPSARARRQRGSRTARESHR